MQRIKCFGSQLLGLWFSPAVLLLVIAGGLVVSRVAAQEFVKLQYNNPGLEVDLGVGLWAWPLPMDWDEDGDMDLVVSCPDKPYSGIYFFENTQGNVKLPVFEPGVRVGPGRKNLQVSYVDDKPRVLEVNKEFVDFRGKVFDPAKMHVIYEKSKIYKTKGNQRFNVWSYVDFDGDGNVDLMAGLDDWGFYGWDDGFDESGKWKRGPLHGLVFILRNRGTNEKPEYDAPMQLEADGKPLNVYGNPMPNMADFDGDGDLDLVCGEFLDGLTYFENTGTRKKPVYSSQGYLKQNGQKIRLHVQMITPTAIDWDSDGDADLVVGDEDGRAALIENKGVNTKGDVQFEAPAYFQQKARDLKFGALITPVACDWDEDGDTDLVCGNTSGNIAWFENLGGKPFPSWDKAKLLKAGGKEIRIEAGENGSIQGPAEAKWGYTTLSVADWDGDGRQDIVYNSILGKVEWLRNVGKKGMPELEPAQPVVVKWPAEAPKPAWTWWNPAANELVTQWRTTPVVMDWNGDGLQDLVMLDHEGYLAYFERQAGQDGELWLSPGKRVFAGGSFDSRQRNKEKAGPLRLNVGQNGGSGRRKLCFVDWDKDGDFDLILNSVNANWLRNDGNSAAGVQLTDTGPLSPTPLAGHTTSPTTVDWDGDGVQDLVLGAEDGRLYYLQNPHSQKEGE